MFIRSVTPTVESSPAGPQWSARHLLARSITWIWGDREGQSWRVILFVCLFSSGILHSVDSNLKFDVLSSFHTLTLTYYLPVIQTRALPIFSLKEGCAFLSVWQKLHLSSSIGSHCSIHCVYAYNTWAADLRDKR